MNGIVFRGANARPKRRVDVHYAGHVTHLLLRGAPYTSGVTGWNWGNHGVQAHALAYSLLRMAQPFEALAEKHYKHFLRAVVAKLEGDWELTQEAILSWLERAEATWTEPTPISTWEDVTRGRSH